MQSVNILVVTSTRGFGQLIQQTLEESSRYTVTLVDSVSEAITSIEQGTYALSILDDEIKGGSLEHLAHSLRAVQPDLKLIVIPPDNDLTSPIIDSIVPQGYLTKPFYLPDLFDTIEEVLDYVQAPSDISLKSPAGNLDRDDYTNDNFIKEMQDLPGTAAKPLDWLEDVNLAAQHLTRLSLESAAHAALIVRNDQLWAYAGQLSQQAVEELASIVNDFWHKDGVDTGTSGDKVRFTRLKTTAIEYLLYVTALGDGMVLALAFDTETPFSKIRAQAVKLARALASPPNHIIEEALSDLNEQRQKAQDESIKFTSPTRGSQSMPGKVPLSEANVIYESHTSGTKNSDEIIKPGSPSLSGTPPPISLSGTPPKIRGQIGTTLFSQKVVEPLKADDLRPISPAMHYLNFACLLIPRIPTHHLISELASSLAMWLGELCLAYGWRLEHQSIRPGYLLWIAHVSPSTSPSFHLRMIRKQTSQRIFAEFPHFKKENPSGDFWAPGYLIVSSAQPPAADIINQYIDRTRHHQGA